MQHYTLTDARNRHKEVFEKASLKPVVLTNQSFPSHVLMSAKTYQQLIERLQELEEEVLVQAVEAALSQSQMIEVEALTFTVQGLANID